MAIAVDRAAKLQRPNFIAEAQALHPEQPCKNMHWSRKGRALECRVAVCPIKKINAGAFLKLQSVERAYSFKKRDGVAIAPHEKMLAVINRIACPCVNERISPASEMIAPLDEHNFELALAQADSGCKPGKAASDYHNTLHCLLLLSLLRIHIRRAIFIRRDFGIVRRLRK